MREARRECEEARESARTQSVSARQVILLVINNIRKEKSVFNIMIELWSSLNRTISSVS